MNSLAILLGALLLSFVVTSVALIPFINTLYRLRFLRLEQETRDVFGVLTPVFNAFHKKKAGVPVGGGLLVILTVSILFAMLLPILSSVGVTISSVYENTAAEINILFFTFLSFAVIGLYDDIKKFFKLDQKGLFGLRMKHKLMLQLVLASIISVMLHTQLGISFIHVPFFTGVVPLELGWLYIPFAAFTIVAFANAVNITDGLDGLASGTLMISLFGLWFLSSSILDVPLSIFIALWLGSLIAFLYFNVFPARIFMGDVGSMAFGATLAVIGLLLGKIVALTIIGFIFVAEISSSLLQLISKRWLGRRVLPAAPLHLTLQKMGWEEPKIVQRAWLLQIILTLFGVWLTAL
jgi:phospho-N-acetylmuramoyl-pentapeptide-transferase